MAQHHSEETKAAVMAAILAGMSIAEISRQYKLPKQTVSRLKSELSQEALGQVAVEKRIRIDDLLVEGLASNLQAQKRIADTSSEAEYIRKQPATAVAELYRAFADTAIRLLEAASFGEGDTEEEPGAEDADVPAVRTEGQA